MSEKDTLGTIIPFSPLNRHNLPKTRFESEPGKIISITEVKPRLPFNVIIFSRGDLTRGNMKQFIDTANFFTEVEKGGEMPIIFIANATLDTGDIAVEVERISLPEEVERVLQGEYQGVIYNEKGAVAWQGGNRMLITSLDSPVNPFTDETLTPPAQISKSNILQFPQSPQTQPAENPASHLSGGNVVPQNNDNLRTFIRPLTQTEVDQATGEAV